MCNNILLYRSIVLTTVAIFTFLLNGQISSAQQDTSPSTKGMNYKSICTSEALTLLKKGSKLYANQSFTDAHTNFLAAADMDCAEAQSMIGALYDNGFGVKQNYEEAMKWFTLAAKKDYPPALFGIGVLFRDGRGVSKNYKIASDWIRKSAEMGYDSAQFNLGVMYIYGHGVSQDVNEAAKWWRLSSAQGNENAKKNLEFLKSRGMLK